MTLDGRVVVPGEAQRIMAARALENSHPILLDLLVPDMSVLDVGCGPGTLTAEIARRVDPGAVVGMDLNPDMIRIAEDAHPPGTVPNLVFYAGDVRASGWDGEFDLVNGARVLQWIPEPRLALRSMARAAAPGGLVVALDYDHTRAQWSDPPEAWRRFFAAFLEWRTASGLDNAVARRLSALSTAEGLREVERRPHVATVRAGDADFFRAAGQWRMIIESRGRQMVASGRITEKERRAAREAFTEWMRREDAIQTLHEACLVARRPGPTARRSRSGTHARPSRRPGRRTAPPN